MDAPYEAARLGRFACAGVNGEAVDAFRADVDARMPLSNLLPEAGG